LCDKKTIHIIAIGKRPGKTLIGDEPFINIGPNNREIGPFRQKAPDHIFIFVPLDGTG